MASARPSSASAISKNSTRIIICAASRCAPADAGSTPKARASVLARPVWLPRLNVGHAQHLRELEIVGRPLAGALEQRQRLRQSSREVVREAEHLFGFPLLDGIAWQLRDDGRERLDGLRVVVRMVVRHAEQLGDPRVAAIEGRQRADGFARLSLVHQLPGRRELRGETVGRRLGRRNRRQAEHEHGSGQRTHEKSKGVRAQACLCPL
jgi:hypothetical protein